MAEQPFGRSPERVPFRFEVDRIWVEWKRYFKNLASAKKSFLYIPAGPNRGSRCWNATQVPRDIRFNMDAGMGNYDSTMR